MPILDPHTLEFFSRSSAQTSRLGVRLGALLRAGDLICLQGDLGAGKTTFVQGLAKGWGSLDSVSSPTFVLVNIYRRPDEIHFAHMDTYRLETVVEAEELDFESLLLSGPLVVEWAERVQSILPTENLWIHMDYVDDEQRVMRLTPRGERYETLLAELRADAFGAT